MIIDAKRKIIRLQLSRLGWIVALTAFSILVAYDMLFAAEFFKPYKVWIILALVVCYALFYCWGIFRGHGYFFYSDNSTKLIFRFYKLRPLGRKLKMIEIPKSEFGGFQIRSYAGGFWKRLFVMQHMKGKVAKYKPISISLLSKKEIAGLEESLNLYRK